MKNKILLVLLLAIGFNCYSQTPVYKTTTSALNGVNAIFRSGTDSYSIKDSLILRQLKLTLTTTGISGVSSLNGAILNIPNYTSTAYTGSSGIALVGNDFRLDTLVGRTVSNSLTKAQIQSELNLKANIASPTFTGTVSGITKSMVGLANVDNTSDANKPVSTLTQTALNLKIDLSQKASPSGVASLNSSGKVPLAQIDDVLLGAVNYQGTYNAATNTPALFAASSSNKGYYYIASTAGTQFGLTLSVGDWIISNGSSYGKVDNNNSVTSVAGRTGAVVLVESDIANLVSDLALKAPIASPIFTGIVTTPTVNVSGLTASSVVSTDASKNLTSLSATNGVEISSGTLRLGGNVNRGGTILNFNSGNNFIDANGGNIKYRVYNSGGTVDFFSDVTNGGGLTFVSSSSIFRNRYTPQSVIPTEPGIITEIVGSIPDVVTGSAGFLTSIPVLANRAGWSLFSNIGSNPFYYWTTLGKTIGIGKTSAPQGQVHIWGVGITNATNTQVWSNSNATENARLNDAGELLIGTTTSNGNKLRVNGNADISGTVTAPTFIGALTGNASTVTINANLTGEATSVGNATTLTNSAVIGKVLTGYVSGAGIIAATDNILQAVQKLNGNQTITLTGDITGSGNGSFATAIGAGKVTNSMLLNRTISGKALGTNLSTLTFASYLSGTSYNGTSDVTIQVNASQVGAVSSIVASNAFGDITLGGGILAGGSEVFTATNQLTAATYGRLSNSNGSLLYGVYNDSGTGFGATNIAGMTANAAGIGTTGNTPYQVFTNGIVRQTIAANGATSFAQALSAFNLSGTNTGDQATVSGNAGSATVLQNARTIQGVSFNGSSNINIINGTGLVRVIGTTLSYDTNSYLTGTQNTLTSHSSYEASPIIPFNTWTTFYTITGGVGNYIVSIGLDGQPIADWSAHGMIYSGGSDAAFFLQHNGSVVQIRISGLNIQVYQNGTAGSGIALHASVLRIGGLNP